MRPKLGFSSLKESRWYEYVTRFALGGGATVLAGAINGHFGPSAGGLFLAFPAILCASATLIEKHEIRRKRDAGMTGARRGQEAAALDAVGAALGSLGMLAFAVCFSWSVQQSVVLAFSVALVAWAAVSMSAWWVRQHLRAAHRLAGGGNHRPATGKQPVNRSRATERAHPPA